MNSQFSVPKPCHENWAAMTPAEQGRFCGVCSKTVTDFTQMSHAEITIYLLQNRGNRVCGRFRNDQLEEKTAINIPKAVLYSQTKFINVFLLALLVTMGSMLFSCGNNEEHDPRWEAEAKPADSLPPLPEERMNHTLGIAAYPEEDTIPPPPVKEAPKTLMGEVEKDSTKHK